MKSTRVPEPRFKNIFTRRDGFVLDAGFCDQIAVQCPYLDWNLDSGNPECRRLGMAHCINPHNKQHERHPDCPFGQGELLIVVRGHGEVEG